MIQSTRPQAWIECRKVNIIGYTMQQKTMAPLSEFSRTNHELELVTNYKRDPNKEIPLAGVWDEV